MRKPIHIVLFVYCCTAYAMAETISDDVPVALDDHHSDHYEWLNLQGFWVQVRFPEDMNLGMIEDYTETLDF